MSEVSSYVPEVHLVCRVCGQVREQHHRDGRCYTDDELLRRMTFYLRTQRWPGPDEGCEPQEIP